MGARAFPPILPALLLAGIGAAALVLFLIMELTGRGGYVARISLPSTVDAATLPDIRGDESLPLVVIDPGHGGHDPGASGSGFEEKDVVLGLARAVRDELEREGGVRVALTRNDDSYLLHAERYEIARRLGARLFLSIHADSAGEEGTVGGASIYTLSNRASSGAAARFAARENAADKLNGVDLNAQSDTVSSILVDLAQRRTSSQSDEIADLMRREGEGVIAFHPQDRRYAALKVLRAPDVPSVLFESGFITNADDAERLTSPEGRKRFASAIARAIRIYLAKESGSD